jgi:hypothetical protein
MAVFLNPTVFACSAKAIIFLYLTVTNQGLAFEDIVYGVPYVLVAYFIRVLSLTFMGRNVAVSPYNDPQDYPDGELVRYVLANHILWLHG